MEEVHLTYLHIGAPKMIALLSARYFWPRLHADCVAFVKACFSCQLADSTRVAPQWHSLIPLPPGPRHTWALDLLVELPAAHGTKAKHILLAVDCFTKYVLLQPLGDKSSDAVATFLRTNLISVFGPPHTIRTDNGTEFAGTADTALSLFSALHIRSSPYHSEGNGGAERQLRTLQHLLRKTLTGLPLSTWTHFLPELQYTLNSTFNKATGTMPYLLMFGAPPPPLLPSLSSP